MTINCIIADDEPLSLDVLEKHIGEIPALQLKGRFLNAIEALDFMQKNETHLIFLDINMPKLSGISMVKAMKDPPMIIFTTAYPEFALEGFNLDAVDYLVKPISFERFMKAVNKAIKMAEFSRNRENGENGYITVKSDKKIYRIPYNDIIFIQSIGDFVKIHTGQKVIINNETLRNLELTLPPRLFIRTHKSYILGIRHIRFIEGNQVKIGNETLPIGLTFRDSFLEKFRNG